MWIGFLFVVIVNQHMLEWSVVVCYLEVISFLAEQEVLFSRCVRVLQRAQDCTACTGFSSHTVEGSEMHGQSMFLLVVRRLWAFPLKLCIVVELPIYIYIYIHQHTKNAHD